MIASIVSSLIARVMWSLGIRSKAATRQRQHADTHPVEDVTETIRRNLTIERQRAQESRRQAQLRGWPR